MKYERVAIYYPPITRDGEVPLLAQNRQFKFSRSAEIRIYPVVMASLATALTAAGYEVLWLDGTNLRYSFDRCRRELEAFKPDVFVLETKAPLFAQHLDIAHDLKEKYDAAILMCGDHVSFFPIEAVAEGADYAIVGGDYDFSVPALLDHLNGTGVAMPGGIVRRQDDDIVSSGSPELHNLDEAPLIDRDLTRWDRYGEAYLYRPAAYIMSGRGCGGANTNVSGYESSAPGVCSFCIWQHALWNCTARLRSPVSVADEIEMLVTKYGVKEIFDDNESGGIWSQAWLEDLYRELHVRRLVGRFSISSNARADSLTPERCKLLREMGFRLLKIGLESGNDRTLQVIHKSETAEQIETGIRNAKNAGLRVLMTTMVGYPWETEADAARTYALTKSLMLHRTHFGDSLQSSIVTPYPGTPLYRLAEENGWLTKHAGDYSKYDMTHAILKTDIDTVKWCHRMWRIHLHPLFVIRSLLSIRSAYDVKLAVRGVASLFGHLRDYDASNGKRQ